MSLTTEHMTDKISSKSRFEPTGAEMRAIRGLEKVVAEFRDMKPPMPLFELSVFLTVAAHQGVTQREIQQRMGAKNVTNVNTSILRLTNKPQANGEPGRGLVEQRAGYPDTRTKTNHLTRSGEITLIALLHALGVGHDDP